MLKKQKYKFLSLILSIVFIFSSTAMIYPVQNAYASNGAPTLQTAPLNPAFLDFRNKANQQSNASNDQSVQTHPLGYIPSPFLLPNRNVVKKLNAVDQPLTSFPTSYDLRTTNKLTDVRDQSTSGSCWAFGAIGSLESTLMPQEKLDFSENNLKNNSGFDIGPNDGGHDFMSMAYLARWEGPVSEADDPYNPNSTSSPKMQPQKHAQGVQQFGYKDQSFSDIKSMVMQSGAVATSFYWNGAYFNNTTNSYNYDGTGGYYSNHEVDIVGWDDNYPKENFLITPSTNGAFIVRNSWGPSWGDHGYFYISYWDHYAGTDNAVFNKVENTNNYSTNYQYDPLGWTTSLTPGDFTDTAWMANAFSATSSEPLSAISLYTPVPNSTYEIRVYNNFTGTFDTKAPITVGTIPMAGYHTISLGNSIPVNTGEKFAVSVKLTTPGYTYPIPIEYPVQDYSTKATASPGQSYVSNDGNNWTDLTGAFLNTNVCLKVFTTKASANGVIAGKVTNANGDPLAGVFIVAESVNSVASANAVAISSGKTKTLTSKALTSTLKSKNLKTNSSDITTISNADGTYTLNVPPGNYNLFLWPDPVNNIDYGYQYYNNQLGPATANVIPVASDQTTTINPTLAIGGKTSGLVTGLDGLGLSDIDVIAYNQYGMGVGTSTDSNGHYEIPGMAATTYKVEFDPTNYNASHGTNYAQQWYNNQPDESSANSVTVVAGQPLDNINAQLHDTGSVPGIPTGLIATPVSSTQIDLSWYSVSGATSYNVYEASSAYGTFTQIANTTSNSYTRNNLAPGTTYYYKVSAVNASGEGGQSSVASATTFNGTNGVISGRVTNASGAPLSGVWVSVDSVYGGASVDKVAVSHDSKITMKDMKNKSLKTKNINQYYDSTTTNADGTYTLNVPPGNYTMFCWFTSPVDGIDYGFQYYDNKLSSSTADVIPVASDQTKTINPILAVGGRISGVVTDPNGTSLPNILVIARNQNGSMGIGTWTDSNGHYEIPGVAATSYKVEFDPSDYNASHGTNYAQQWYNNQPSESSANLVTVDAGQKVENINAQLQGTGSVPGIPTGLTATPVSSTQINLSWNSVNGATSYNVYEASNSYGTFTQIANTTSNSYTRSNLTPGTTYYYKVSAVNASGEGGQSSAASATTFNDTNGVISGRVKNASGDSLPGVRVTAKNIDQESSDVTAVSQWDGSYLMYLPQGNYILSFWADPINGIDYGYQYYNNRLGPNVADVIQVVNAQSKTIDVTMAVGGRISGQVTDPNGTGLQGIEVMVFNRYGLSVGTETDSKGYYEILGLAATTYKVKFDPTNYNTSHGTKYAQQWYNKNSLAVVAGHTVPNINAKLQGSSSKSGTPASQGSIPAKVQGLTVKGISENQVDLKWSAVSGAASYTIYRSTSPIGTYAIVGTCTSPMVSYSDKNLNATTSYYYKVSAVNRNGEGLQSSAINALIKKRHVPFSNWLINNQKAAS